jgi:hypothetical protein
MVANEHDSIPEVPAGRPYDSTHCRNAVSLTFLIHSIIFTVLMSAYLKRLLSKLMAVPTGLRAMLGIDPFYHTVVPLGLHFINTLAVSASHVVGIHWQRL